MTRRAREPIIHALRERQRVLIDELLASVAARQGAAAEIGPEVMAELEQALHLLAEALAARAHPSATRAERPAEVRAQHSLHRAALRDARPAVARDPTQP